MFFAHELRVDVLRHMRSNTAGAAAGDKGGGVVRLVGADRLLSDKQGNCLPPTRGLRAAGRQAFAPGRASTQPCGTDQSTGSLCEYETPFYSLAGKL